MKTPHAYAMARRPYQIGAQPRNAAHVDEDDKRGRFGVIYYAEPLTPQEVDAFELVPLAAPFTLAETTPAELTDEARRLRDRDTIRRAMAAPIIGHQVDTTGDLFDPEHAPAPLFATPTPRPRP